MSLPPAAHSAPADDRHARPDPSDLLDRASHLSLLTPAQRRYLATITLRTVVEAANSVAKVTILTADPAIATLRLDAEIADKSPDVQGLNAQITRCGRGRGLARAADTSCRPATRDRGRHPGSVPGRAAVAVCGCGEESRWRHERDAAAASGRDGTRLWPRQLRTPPPCRGERSLFVPRTRLALAPARPGYAGRRGCITQHVGRKGQRRRALPDGYRK